MVRKQKGKAKRQLGRQTGRLDTLLVPGSGEPSEPSQIVHTMMLQYPTTVVSTDAGGNIATAFSPSIGGLTQFSSYQGTYDEGRIIGIDFKVQAAASNAGCSKFQIDDSDSTNPTTASMNAKRHYLLNNNHLGPKSSRIFRYRCEDLEDLKFLDMATGSGAGIYTPCSLKIYTDQAVLNSPNSQKLWIIEAVLTVQFRGIGGHS